MRSIALLHQQRQQLGLPLDSSSIISSSSNNHNHSVGNQLFSAPRRSGTNQSMTTDASTMVSGGLSPSELRSATSLQNHERMMTAELLKQHQQHLGHEEQVVKAMALASRGLTLSMQTRNRQQHNQNSREDLILKRAISQLNVASRYYPIQQHDRSLPSHDSCHPTSRTIPMDDPNGNPNRDARSLFCPYQNLSPEKDICFGRGQGFQRRNANVAFRKIVATNQETYDQAVSREDKKAVVKKVSRILTRKGYRFFKESEETTMYGDRSKMWVAVSDFDVEYKIGHSFRSGRKQIKQQQKHNQRKDIQGKGNVGLIGKSGIQTNSNTKDKKSQSRSIAAMEPNNDESVFKEDELSDRCICIGDQREKYTGMEAYQYFREFILTFKSICGMSESFDEKTKIVSSLIEQIKSRKGYRFLKLMSMRKDAEFWIEASADDIQCEVLFILGNPLQPPKENTVENQSPPKKRQRLLPDRTSIDNCSRPSTVKRSVSDFEQPEKIEDKTTTKPRSLGSPIPNISNNLARENIIAGGEDLASSSSVSSTTKSEETPPWKKGRKRTLPNANKKHSNRVSSETVSKQPAKTGKFDGNSATDIKLKNGTYSICKADREAMSATLRQGLSVPLSLSLPSAFFGNMAYDNFYPTATRGNLSLASNMTSGEKMLQGSKGRQQQIPGFGLPSTASGSDTLGKALHAMRFSTSPPPNFSTTLRSREQSMMVGKAKQIDNAEKFEMRAKLLEQLKQQELLYIEKKHKLDMLDLQLRSPDSRM